MHVCVRSTRRLISAAILTSLIAVASSSAALAVPGQGWLRFRGPHGSGISEEDGLPSELNTEKNLHWKSESGTGFSSPTVVDRRLFLTSHRDDDRLLHCLDATTGASLWTKSFPKLRREIATPPSGPATPTTVADEFHVYAFFPDTGVVCCSHTGDERWRVDPGPFHSFHGVSSSLVVVEGKLVLLVDQLQDSFMVAYDCRTGGQAWKINRDDGALGGYSTPSTRQTIEGKTELVVTGPFEVAAFDPATGTRNWSLEGVTAAPISAPVVSGNKLFLCEPSFTENPFKIDVLLPFDKDKDGKVSLEELKPSLQYSRVAKRVDERWGNGDGIVEADELEKAFQSFIGGGGLVAIQLESTAGVTKPRILWTYRKVVPPIASVLHYRNVLFFINQGGILTSMNPETGEILKRARLGHGSGYYASPVAADGKLYLVDTDGQLAVVSAEAEWKVLSTGSLGESCHATPAIANRCIYIRSQQSLYCFGQAE